MTPTQEAVMRQALEALELGYDSAKAEADQYHAAMAGYRPQRHAQMDADVQKIAAAITALRAALAEPEGGGNLPPPLPGDFDHGIGADRFKVVRGAFWWHVLIGDSPTEHGKFRSRASAEKMAADLLREFRNGAFVQHEAALAEPPDSTKPDVEPTGWLEAPHGAFRANPNLKHEFPPQSLEWRIPLFAALAEPVQDWSLLEATQESLREHMAEIQRLRAALAEPDEFIEDETIYCPTCGEEDGGTTCGMPDCGLRCGAEPVQEPEPVGWFEGPFGEFRANPLHRIAWPAQTVAWSIPLYLAPPQRPAEPVQEPGQDLIPPESLFVCGQMGAHVTRVRLAEPVQKPVAWRYKYSDGFWRFSNGARVNGCDPIESQALYTSPPQRKPLTDEEIRRIKPVSPDLVDFRSGVRCAEWAHGIGGNK